MTRSKISKKPNGTSIGKSNAYDNKESKLMPKNRITKVVTKTGDGGQSGLADGKRLPKSHEIFDAIGTIDELNSLVGILRTYPVGMDLQVYLANIQHDLFSVGAQLAGGSPAALDEAISDLEDAISAMNEDLGPLKEFILPGGTASASVCHYIRTVARRAERECVKAGVVLPYINRLSDYFFVAARYLNYQAGKRETTWVR